MELNEFHFLLTINSLGVINKNLGFEKNKKQTTQEHRKKELDRPILGYTQL